MRIKFLLQFGLSGDRIPVEARLSAPVQNDPGAHPAFCTVGTVSFLVVKQPGRVVYHQPTYSADIKERVEQYLYTPSRPPWPAR